MMGVGVTRVSTMSIPSLALKLGSAVFRELSEGCLQRREILLGQNLSLRLTNGPVASPWSATQRLLVNLIVLHLTKIEISFLC